MTTTQKSVITTAVLVLFTGVGVVMLWNGYSQEKAPVISPLPLSAKPHRRAVEAGAAVSADLKPVPVAPDPGSEDESELSKLRRELASTKGELEKLSRPLRVDMASATVSATLKNGESLVTGGYQTRDGNYELTFLTPNSIRMADGREAIEIRGQILSLSPEAIASSGLETMATNARNTIQHAEAWGQDEMEGTLAAIREKTGQQLLSSPKVTALPGEQVSITIGGDNGTAYALEATVGRDAAGDFTIKSRIESDEKNQRDSRPSAQAGE